MLNDTGISSKRDLHVVGSSKTNRFPHRTRGGKRLFGPQSLEHAVVAKPSTVSPAISVGTRQFQLSAIIPAPSHRGMTRVDGWTPARTAIFIPLTMRMRCDSALERCLVNHRLHSSVQCTAWPRLHRLQKELRRRAGLDDVIPTSPDNHSGTNFLRPVRIPFSSLIH